MLPKVKLYAIGALIVVLISAMWFWRADIQRAAVAASNVAALIEALESADELREQLERNQRLVSELNMQAQAQIAQIDRSQAELERRIRELEQTDEQVADWNPRPIPDVFADRLRPPTKGDSKP
ncbi:MAG: hypothetical protein LAT50_12150 [Ectothiorhodospiraceae bacterium]|nr:hypothetical protein [Ectothiorhodospiraceae bacterium]